MNEIWQDAAENVRIKKIIYMKEKAGWSRYLWIYELICILMQIYIANAWGKFCSENDTFKLVNVILVN